MSRWPASIILVLSACAYRPGSFDSPFQEFPGARATLTCLDVSIELARDPQSDGPVIGYTFGNRCDQVTTVDLSSVVVTGTMLDGARTMLRPFDPDRELRPLMLEARAVAREQIEYRAPGRAPLRHGVCADIGRFNGAAGARWICLEDGGAS